MSEPEYKIRLPQLKMLRDILIRKEGNVDLAVAEFVEHYVHAEKKESEFWAPIAQQIKDDPNYVSDYEKSLKQAK